MKRLALCKSVGCCLVLGCRFGWRTSVGEPICFMVLCWFCFPGEYARVANGPEISVHRVLAQV